jgi:hypothetical protein
VIPTRSEIAAPSNVQKSHEAVSSAVMNASLTRCPTIAPMTAMATTLVGPVLPRTDRAARISVRAINAR